MLRQRVHPARALERRGGLGRLPGGDDGLLVLACGRLLLRHAPVPAHATHVPLGPLPPSQERQHRAVVGPVDAPDRAPALLLHAGVLPVHPRQPVHHHRDADLHGPGPVARPLQLRQDRHGR